MMLFHFRDYKCGKLMCDGGAEFPIIGSLAKASLGYQYDSNYIRHTCKTASIDLGEDIPDPGYVLDGSLCGTTNNEVGHGFYYFTISPLFSRFNFSFLWEITMLFLPTVVTIILKPLCIYVIFITLFLLSSFVWSPNARIRQIWRYETVLTTAMAMGWVSYNYV